MITMPEDVKKIINTLEGAGYEAYAVGGCVRDALLGRIPNDWDITTSAKPLDVKTLFKKTFDTGIQHGTVTVLMGGEGYEVTTYRIDGLYEDARHPKEVTFTDDLLEDLKRRDFTINAMAYSDATGIIDAFDGQGDLERGIIRCVGNPQERFSEDALRMMRAIRFAAQLGFELEKDTKAAISELAPNLKMVSAERIMAELTKLIMSNHPEMIRDAYECKLTAQFLPEFDICMECEQNNPHHIYNVGEHIIHTMMNVRADRILRFTMLLHDIAKPQTKTVDEEGITHNKGHATLGADMSREILRRLKSDNELVNSVKVLVKYHDWRFESNKRSVRRAASKIGTDLFPMLLEVQRADLSGQSNYQLEEKQTRISDAESLYNEILEDRQALSIKDLAVNGKDLISIGVNPGPELGDILSKLLDYVLDNPEENTREALIEYINSLREE